MAGALAAVEERRLQQALREGSEEAFSSLVDRYHPALLRLAMVYVRNRAVAEEVVQETWLGVLSGIERFEARSSLKTWIFRILTNTAKTRAERERRTIPFSSLGGDEAAEGPAVDSDRFLDASHPDWPGHWASAPSSWSEIPENRLLSDETMSCIETAIAALPVSQREVITLRDVAGWPAEEVCELLDISEANQRVLLHRARSKVRQALESYLDG